MEKPHGFAALGMGLCDHQLPNTKLFGIASERVRIRLQPRTHLTFHMVFSVLIYRSPLGLDLFCTREPKPPTMLDLGAANHPSH